MASTSEIGHAKNAANLETLITIVLGYGMTYKPTKASIKVTELQALSTSANSSLLEANTAFGNHENAKTKRWVFMRGIKPLCTRVVNALQSSDVPKSVVDGARIINRKIQGTSLKSKEEIENVNGASPYQTDIDSRLGNLSKLIQYLESIPEYLPNEADLTVTALKEFYTGFKASVGVFKTTETNLSNARIARDKIFYTPESGMVSVALDAKAYVLSVFGATSLQYKQVSKLKFTDLS